ncbi:MAG: DUF5110 domain-containing protein, partial [Acetatifactor sp.]|nr:DUF5110 domain-containing protein [Acetatifactor sp.]
ARTCNDEFLLGDRILAAPVVCQGMTKRMVYLPEGAWYDYWTDEKIIGPAWIIKDAPLEVCPIYVKAGSVIPAMEPMSYVGEKEEDVLLLDVYPGTGKWEHYQDNGEDFAYQNGEYNQYQIVINENGILRCSLAHHGYGKIYRNVQANRFGTVTELEIQETAE